MNTTRPDKSYTLSDFISEGLNSEVLCKDLTLLHRNGSCIFPVNNILDKYLGLIDEYIVNVELTDDEFEFYKYHPKRLSLTLYGTVELWFLILKANRMLSVTEFNTKKIKIYNKAVLKAINTILIKDKHMIDENRMNIMKD